MLILLYHASIVGGLSNTASGVYSSIIGGRANSATQSYTIAGGYCSLANGTSSIALGQENSANFDHQLATGLQSGAYIYGAHSHASGQFAARGDAQTSTILARRFDNLIASGGAVLHVDGVGSEIIRGQGNNYAWQIIATWTAVVTSIIGTADGVSVGDVITQTNALTYKRVAGTSSITGVDTLASHSDLSMSTATMAYTVGALEELIPTFNAPSFTGGGQIGVRILNKMMLTEIRF
jgi:hypothetical protein